MLGLFTIDSRALNQIYNVACGEQTSLAELVKMLQDVSGKNIAPIHGPERAGDVKHSKADIGKIQKLLGYEPTLYFRQGLASIYKWYVANK
jgi:UDP-N-acetylglucosamine 4-epimerase